MYVVTHPFILVSDKTPKIRNISFTSLEADNHVTYNVGLWGDYIMRQGVPILEQVNENIIPALVGADYNTVKTAADVGYGNFRELEGMPEDILLGATVSGSNVVSIVKSIFEYHMDKYY